MGIRFTSFQRRFLFALILLSWVSGITFFVLNTWVTVEGEFGPQKHPQQFNVLKAHGAAAFLQLMVFGYLLADHVPKGWRVTRMRGIGLTLVIAQSLLVVSAYGLYYMGDEDRRQIVAYVHYAVGFSLPFLLIAHLIQGRWGRRWRKRPARVESARSSER
ncbi:MAG: hypothetical protein AAF772_00560 [Acidobacteriota bacterium]